MKRSILRFFSNKCAITPVLSSLLLTVVAVGAMALATTATYVITTNMKETMGERIIVEDLWFNPSAETIEICVRNVGKIAIQVSAIYVNNTPQFHNTFSILEVGTYQWINISCSWVPRSLYHIDIVTVRGSHAGGYSEAP